jgi:hypothetical protein
MSTALATRTVEFDGDALVVVPLGDTWGAVLTTWCDALGVDVDGQVQRLSRLAASGERWACPCKMQVQIPGDDQRREVAVLPRRSLWMWLATIKVSLVKEEVRPKLLRYKERCVDFLDAAWTGQAANDTSSQPRGAARLAKTLVEAVDAKDVEAARALAQAIGGLLGAADARGRIASPRSHKAPAPQVAQANEALAQEILAVIKRQPGCSGRAIRKAIGVRPQSIVAELLRLESAGAVRVERSTRGRGFAYYPITPRP